MLTVTNILCLFTILVSYVSFNNEELKNKLCHFPYSVERNKEYYRWLTSGFVHKDFWHLFINMFVLWQFGNSVELEYEKVFGTYGKIIYFVMYMTAIVFSDLPTFRKYKDNPYYSSLGASGAVSAVMFAFMLFHPWQKLYLYGIIPIYVVIGGFLYLAYEQWASRNANDNKGHDAHFAGAIYGLLFTVVLKPSIYNDFIDELIYNSPFW